MNDDTTAVSTEQDEPNAPSAPEDCLFIWLDEKGEVQVGVRGRPIPFDVIPQVLEVARTKMELFNLRMLKKEQGTSLLYP